MCRLHDDIEVLLVHPALETRFEIATEHALAVVFEDFRVGESAEQRLAYLAAVDAVFCRKSEGLGDRQHAHAGDDLVGRLGDLAGAASADMDDVPAHAREGRLGFGEGRFGTTGHDRQRAGDGADLAAGNRRIHEIDAGSGEIDADLACVAAGAMVFFMSTAPARAPRSCATPRMTSATSGASATIEITSSLPCTTSVGLPVTLAPASVVAASIRAARPDSDLVAALQQVECHRAPHDSEADESDLHSVLPKRERRF